MNVAAEVRREKELHPERFCPNRRCLWRIETRSALEPGVKASNPCPKHMRKPLPQVEMFPDCPRTVCLVNPGTPVPGLKCSYRYNGSVPCTGRLVCHTCGREKPE